MLSVCFPHQCPLPSACVCVCVCVWCVVVVVAGVVGRLCFSATCLNRPAPRQLADVFCPNETEAALITGLPTTTDEEVTVAAREILRRGPKSVLMTLGSNGVLYVDGDGSTIHIPGREVNAVDTSGAGDSFVGSFSAFLAMGVDHVEAMRRAVYVSGESVTGHGTQLSYKGRDDLPSHLFADLE